ncbi:MAG TPA: carboxymuconolactone decarboxylase family protein [Bryobacteraceae bacterium]|nr:carboxymuconolactone decarboxylase family protein [Bryobacteraceae bacterium]
MEKPRLDYKRAGSEAFRAMAGLEQYVHQCGLERPLLELVKFRASQINGCAYCMDMHSKDARQAGETEQRLYTVSAWRETPFYTERERAALAWTEAVTRISPDSVDDDLYREVTKHFNEKELVDLTLAVITINGWNRLAITFRTEPGTYQPRAAKSA